MKASLLGAIILALSGLASFNANAADIEAGKRAGCKSILVLTGYGATTTLKTEAATVEKCRDLDCAATSIINDLITKESP